MPRYRTNMHDETVKVLENKKVNAAYFKLSLACDRVSKKVLPGQFLNLKINPLNDPLWRRPFSYYRASPSKIEILYTVLGRGTELLSAKRKGDKLQALGPLGKPFSLNLKARKRILVAGGVGVPPLIFLAERVAAKEKPLILIGCKSKKEILPASEVSKVKPFISYATDDGSYGTKGFVTVLLRNILKHENPKSLFIQTCGPRAMLSAVVKLAREFGVDGEASIDERMACGVGACLGCMIETTEGWKPSCKEGPVFSFSDLAENF